MIQKNKRAWGLDPGTVFYAGNALCNGGYGICDHV